MIHPTAIIHPGVQLGKDCWVGPYAVIGFPGESRKEPLYNRQGGNVVVGDRAEIHEFARIQSGIYGMTRVGDDLLMMAGAHVGHDTQIGDMVQLSSSCVIGGHTILEDWTNIGLSAVTHQHTHVRKGSFVGAQAFMKGSTGEWEVWAGVPAVHVGRNTVGYERYTTDNPPGSHRHPTG